MEHGASPDELSAIQSGVTRDAKSPVRIAFAAGHISIIHLLMQAGCDVRSIDLYGVTLLHLAAKLGQVEVLETLLLQRPDIDAPDEDGNTALHYAVKHANIDAVKL